MSSKRRLRRQCEKKVNYKDEHEAFYAAKRLNNMRGREAEVTAYKCNLCHNWHVGRASYGDRAIKALRGNRRKVGLTR